MNKERLLILATFLETMVPPEQWNYMWIVGGNWDGAQNLSCGTTGCAIGWAASIPVLRQAGMKLLGYQGFSSDRWFIDSPATFKEAEKVFELTNHEALYLFQPGELEIGHSGLERTATASEVAKHIRRFVKRGGMPGEVVGYAVKMMWDEKNFSWRGKQLTRSEPQIHSEGPVKMTLEEATATAAVCPFDSSDNSGRKVVKIVRKKK